MEKSNRSLCSHYHESIHIGDTLVFRTFGTTLAILAIATVVAAQEQLNETPPELAEPSEQPTVVPPDAMFQRQTHIKMVMPCGPQGQLDSYIRGTQKELPLIVGKSYTHLLGPQGVELRTPGTQILYVGDQFAAETPWSVVIVFPNGLECLLSVGKDFTPVSTTQ